MNSAGKIIGVDFSAPKPQSMTESHFARHAYKKVFPLCCCQKVTYDFVSPDGAKHEAARVHSTCCERMCGWCKCAQLYDTTSYTSAKGPDFTSKFTVDCWRYCCCPCLDTCEVCCVCAQQCGKRHEILDTAGTPLGRIVHPTCWEYCCSCVFPGRNRILLKSLTPDGQQKYIVRDDRTFYYQKFPITNPNEQTPIGWLTLNAARAWACGGLCCCYCMHNKTALIEIDHQHGLPFNERAHLMALAMKMDDALIPYVGCCCNDP